MSFVERIVDMVIAASATAEPAITLTFAEYEAIVELAYLAIAADQVLHTDEIEAFRAVIGQVRGLYGRRDAPLEDADLANLLERFGHDRSAGSVDDRARAVASVLTRLPARELAYRLCFALSLSDDDEGDDEFQLDLTLIDALDLSNDQAERLASEVRAGLA